MALETQIAFFRKHQDELAKKHHGKFVLIHDESIDGVYDSELEAYTVAKQAYAPGTFLIRECLLPDEEMVQVFHSSVAP
jgi:hypothetical protein